MRYATEADRTDQGVIHTYIVHYPSGQTFTVTGAFACLYDAGRVLAVMIRLATDPTSMVALDPRAVIVRDGLIIFEPRARRPQPWVRDWLREHPEWPHLVTEAAP